MATMLLRSGGLSAELRTQGDALAGAWFDGQPILLPLEPGAAACFPLLPFGNRIAGNGFSFGGADYTFEPNTTGDPLYLHGDGWLEEWTVTAQSADRVTLQMRRTADAVSPYSYAATQDVILDDNGLTIALSVTNTGEAPLPFGLGLHPFFPNTAATRLTAPALRMWSEEAGHLPGRVGAVPEDVDFTSAAPLPKRWLNNAFEGWSGQARIDWPERGLSLAIDATETFRHYMIYQPENAGFVCLEPMSHLPDGHHMADLGGLTVLQPDQVLSGSVTFRPIKTA